PRADAGLPLRAPPSHPRARPRSRARRPRYDGSVAARLDVAGDHDRAPLRVRALGLDLVRRAGARRRRSGLAKGAAHRAPGRATAGGLGGAAAAGHSRRAPDRRGVVAARIVVGLRRHAARPHVPGLVHHLRAPRAARARDDPRAHADLAGPAVVEVAGLEHAVSRRAPRLAGRALACAAGRARRGAGAFGAPRAAALSAPARRTRAAAARSRKIATPKNSPAAACPRACRSTPGETGPRTAATRGGRRSSPPRPRSGW